MRRRIVLAAAAAALAACESRPTGPPCDVRVDRLEVALAMLAGEQKLPIDPSVALPEITGGHVPRDVETTISVAANGAVRLRGEAIGTDRERLREALERERDGERTEGRLGLSVLYVAAAPETQLGTLDTVLATVPYGTELRLLGRGRMRPLDIYQDELRNLPRARDVRAKVERAPAGERAVVLAGQLEAATGRMCTPLTLAFQGVAMSESGDKSAGLARDVPAALEKCKCEVKDPDLFEFLLYEIFDAWSPPHRWLPLERQHGLAEATVADLVR